MVRCEREDPADVKREKAKVRREASLLTTYWSEST